MKPVLPLAVVVCMLSTASIAVAAEPAGPAGAPTVESDVAPASAEAAVDSASPPAANEPASATPGGAAEAPVRAAEPVAPAAPPPAPTVPAAPPPPKKNGKTRRGVVLALSLDVALGRASGYPNDSQRAEDPAFYGATPALGGGGFTLMVMGALTQYVTVGPFLSVLNQGNEKWTVASGGGGLRIEAFPLATVRPWLQNLAFYGHAGVGAVNVKLEKPGQKFADLDGTQSLLGVGSFYEFRFGALGLGPDLRFDAVISGTADRVAAVGGLRVSFYPATL